MPEPIRLQVIPSGTTETTGTTGTNTPQRPNSKKNKEKSDNSGLRYPLKQMEQNTDYLQIQIKKYVPVGVESSGIIRQSTSTKKLKNASILSTIFLPVPQNIQDANAVGWGEDSLNSIAAFGVGQVTNTMQSRNLLEGLFSAGSATFEALKGVTKNGQAQKMANNFFASKAVNILGANTSFAGLLARSNGQILNPNTELLFNGVKLRSFNFDFDFTPRSADEAQIVKKIIREFKVNMAPNSTGNGLFLSSPNIFQLSYKTGTEKHKFLHSFKPMALVNMSVNYTGSGTYATYSDTTPVHMKMTLSFQELNPIYSEDYNDPDSGSGVGY